MSTPPPAREARFRSLYDDAYGDVLRFVRRRGEPEHAEDVVAEAFLVVWRRLDDAPTRPDDRRAWLFGIARNCLLASRRSDQRRDALAVRVADDQGPGGQVVADDADVVARRLDLAAAWRRLDAADQEVLGLTVFEDLTSPQAGSVLGITGAAYRLRLMRARRALRRQLAPAAPRPEMEPSHERC